MTKNTNNISLVLGGGGTKGFIHIGVLRYLEEHNYHIQEIAGTSVGALIGSLVALGKTSQEIENIAKELDNSDIIDIDRKSITIGGQKIIDRLHNIVGDQKIEDLPIPFTAIATDLNTGKEVVFDSGSIIDAVRYSISVPGVFSLPDDKRPIVDGGIINNLPINHVSGDHIIASSCRGYGGFNTDIAQKKILGIPLPPNPLTTKKDILMRSLMIMMRRIEDLHIEQHPHAQIIRPYTGDISPYDVGVLNEAIQLGYDEAKNILG